MRIIAFLVLLIAAPVFAQDKAADAEYITKTLYPATTLLYAQTETGDMKMLCTATAIEAKDGGYVFVTASHCACQEDEDTKTVTPDKHFFYVTPDATNEKQFLKANLTGCGYRHAGDDFAIFEVKTDKKFPVVSLGKDPTIMEPIANVASPLGLGKQVFTGTVSATDLDRPVIEEDINWTHATLVQLFGTDGGSSGSSLVCLDQKAICGFVVGTFNRSSIIALPVSRLIKLRQELAAGTYKHWKSDPDAADKK